MSRQLSAFDPEYQRIYTIGFRDGKYETREKFLAAFGLHVDQLGAVTQPKYEFEEREEIKRSRKPGRKRK